MKHIDQFDSVLESALKNISTYITKYTNFVIIVHQNPDGDAIGSALALSNIIKELDKQVNILVDNSIPDNLKFLRGVSDIVVYSENPKKELLQQAEVIIVMDLNDPARMKSIEYDFSASDAKILLIDHHIDPKIEADVMAVDTDATSTGEIVWKLIKSNFQEYINKSIAECCYVAIMTDTGNFRYDRTDKDIFKIAAEIIEYGADPVRLYNDVYNTLSIKATKLLGKALSEIETYYEDKMCIMSISDEDYKTYSCTNDDTEGFVDYTLMLEGVKVGILLKEDVESNMIKISLRSKGEYHVRELGVHFNGGGHKHASGARAENAKLEDVKNELVRLAGIYIFK